MGSLLDNIRSKGRGSRPKGRTGGKPRASARGKSRTGMTQRGGRR